MAFLGSLDISGSALTAQLYRMNIVLQNISNAETTVTENGGPYRRKQAVFQERPLSFESALQNARNRQPKGGVRVAEIVEDQREFRMVYDPTDPMADENGYVQYPNVDTTEERIDLMAASNAFVSNMTALSVVKAMAMKALELGK